MRIQTVDAFDGTSRFGPGYYLDASSAAKVAEPASQRQREWTLCKRLNVLPPSIISTIIGGSKL